MLIRSRKHVAENIRRSNEAALRFSHDASVHPMLMGCAVCPTRHLCGGLNVGIGAVDCLSLCCNAPATCDRVCKNNPLVYVQRRREVDGFELDNVPRVPAAPYAPLPDIIPYVLHGSRRENATAAETVAIPLCQAVNFKTGRARFASRETFCNAYKIGPNARVILCGIDEDAPIERWWALPPEQRVTVLADFRALGVELITSPNYSLIMDRPRWDDLHAIKRIALAHADIQAAGITCALHVNGRTDRDFDRWGEFLNDRPEIECLAYEFLTGAGRIRRRHRHVEWLQGLAHKAARPLDIIIRGAPEILPELRGTFRNVTFLEANSFMKTMNRQRAIASGNASLKWETFRTPRNAPLDELYEHNGSAISLWLRARHGGIAADSRR